MMRHAAKIVLALASLLGGAEAALGITIAPGDLLVTNESTGTVSLYSANGSLRAASFISGLASPDGIAVDAAGNVYVGTNLVNGTISKYNPDGTLSNAGFATGVNQPQELMVDAAGNLLVALYGSNSVVRYSPAGVANLTITTGVTRPLGLALDPSGNIYVTSETAGSVTEYSSSGALLNGGPLISSGLSTPTGLVVDAAGGHIFVTNQGAGTVGEYTLAGALVSSTFITGLGGPAGMVSDGAGHLVFANNSANTVTYYTFAGSLFRTLAVGSNPWGVAVFATPVPEPAPLALIGLALATLVVRRRAS